MNSNLYATNNVFQFLPKVPASSFGGIGIGVANTNMGTDFYSIEVEGDNRFYDCVRGIYVDGYTEINISETDMRSTQMPISSIPDEGENGVLVTTSFLDAMNIWENTITNVRNGIVFLADVLGASQQKIGPVNIYENIIQATLDGNSGSPTNEYVLNGIIADNVLFSPGLLDTVFSPIIIDNNKLYQVHNGIHTQGWIFFEYTYNWGWMNRVQTMNNYISLRQIGYPDSTKQTQFGIQHYASLGGMIYNNMVQGFGNGYDAWFGIMAGDLLIQYTPEAICNTTTETGAGIYFNIPDNLYTFESNLMDDNGFGYVLDGAQIGQQGSSSYASRNLWTNFTGGNYKTYTMNLADPDNSVLWIDTANTDQYPQGVFNENDGFNPALTYSIGNGLFAVSSNSNSTSCSAPQGRLIQNSTSQIPVLNNARNAIHANSIDTLALTNLLEQLVTDSFNYAPFPDAGRTMARQRAYRMLELHHGFANRSQILQNFYATTHNSNTHQLLRIEEALSHNHLQQTTQLLNNFVPRNSVEANSKAFFTAYLHVKQNAFSIQDSLEIHRLVRGCTIRDGFVVPQSRVLYRLKFKDFTNFFDDCGSNVAQRPAQSTNNALDITENRNFELYPNPNDGKMTLLYSLDKEEKGIGIINDITGRQVAIYKLDNKQNQLLISEFILVNGVYFFSMFVDGQLIGTKKLVIIK